MRFLGEKCAKNTFAAGGPPRIQLGSLQRSPRLPETPWLDIRGLLLRGGEGTGQGGGEREEEGKGRERSGRGKRRGKGKGKKGGGRGKGGGERGKGRERVIPVFLFPPQ